MHTYGFERLDVWQKARSFAGFLYKLTKNFPGEERFGLVSQLRKAGISIASNIAEGASRSTCKDQAKFYQIAYGSAVEVLNQLIIANDLNLVKSPDYLQAREKIEEITNKINALRNAALRKGAEEMG